MPTDPTDWKALALEAGEILEATYADEKCDHDVNICFCGAHDLIRRIGKAAGDEEAKASLAEVLETAANQLRDGSSPSTDDILHALDALSRRYRP